MYKMFYIWIPVLILASAFFSATEIAYASVNSARLKSRLANGGGYRVSLALKIAENYDSALGAILVGNNVVNMFASSIATVVIIDYLGEGYAWVATLVITVLVLIFGEIIPKGLAKQFSEKFSVFVSVPITVLSYVLKPITILILLLLKLFSKFWANNVSDSSAVSEDDFENIIDIVEDEGILDEEQCDLLQNALDFDSILAYEVITPRVDMEAIDIRDAYEKNLQIVLASSYSRIPVYEDTPDNIIGILHQNRVLKRLIDRKTRIDIRALLLPVTYVHMTMPLPDVLEKMKDSKNHMVVVLDEYGGTMGILTLEDVMEQLVGEIWDETDEIEREFICIDDTHFEALGEMRINDFFDEFNIDIDEDEDFEDDNTTVGGWVVTMLDGEVHPQDTFTYENLVITVLECDEKRVERIAVEELPVVEEDED